MSGGHNISLHKWLRKVPQPVSVLADDKRIEVPKSGRPWHELEATILSLAPKKIVLLDAAGSTLRAKSLSDLVQVADDDEPATEAQSDLQLFAKLLADAYEKGSKASAPLIGEAMTFVQSQGSRIAQMEREIDKLRNHNTKLQAEILRLSAEPPPSEGDEGGIMGAILQGALAAQAGDSGPVPIKRGAK